MSNIGIQALLMPLASTHLMLTHHDLMGMIEFVRAFGNSYRLAASEPESDLLHGRLAFNFCRGVGDVVVSGRWSRRDIRSPVSHGPTTAAPDNRRHRYAKDAAHAKFRDAVPGICIGLEPRRDRAGRQFPGSIPLAR